MEFSPHSDRVRVLNPHECRLHEIEQSVRLSPSAEIHLFLLLIFLLYQSFSLLFGFVVKLYERDRSSPLSLSFCLPFSLECCSEGASNLTFARTLSFTFHSLYNNWFMADSFPALLSPSRKYGVITIYYSLWGAINKESAPPTEFRCGNHGEIRLTR